MMAYLSARCKSLEDISGSCKDIETHVWYLQEYWKICHVAERTLEDLSGSCKLFEDMSDSCTVIGRHVR